MSETRPAEGYLLLLGAGANVLGILSFAGIKDHPRTAFALLVTFAMVGIVASLFPLVSAARLFLSAHGRFFPSTYHVRNLGLFFLILLISVGCAIAAYVSYGEI